ncbi:MAG: YkgJ family cysteine cluster protein [Candidatus Eremiobacteraeota bacterium]|nr:YkgJ family cysteine cluster protein [Candidatus Eremiobacteraeota bacterium]
MERLDLDLIDGLFDYDTDPANVMDEFRRIKGLRFDGSACATCSNNCCIVNEGEIPRGFPQPEIDTIVAVHPEFADVYASKRWRIGKNGRRYYVAAKRGPCVFLGEDRRCRVYDVRPLSCRVVPATEYWMRGHDEMDGWLDDCPGSSYTHPIVALNDGDAASAALLAFLHNKKRAIVSLFVDRGLPDAAAKRAAALALTRHYGGEFYEERLPFAAGGPVLAALAVAYCDAYGVPALGLPWRSERKAIRALTKGLRLSSRLWLDDGLALDVLAPFAGKGERAMLKLGRKLGAPYDLVA